MKRTLSYITLLLLTIGTPAVAQELKVGIVNMQEVIQGFYKSRQAQVDLNARRDEIKKDLDIRRAKLQELAKELETLKMEIEDPSTTQEFKRMKSQEFEAKRNEGVALERDIQQLARQREEQLRLEMERTFRGISDEVQVVVEEIAMRDGYDLVFDSAGIGMRGTPFLLYSKDAVNFTSSVLEELNKDAPEEALEIEVPDAAIELGTPEPEAGE
jgi:outer membrane protein